MSDAINPDHYKRLPAEAIEIIESAIDNAPSNQDAYLHGQVLKYILRCWNKNGIEDLKEAKLYLDRLVNSLDEYEKQKDSDLQSLKDHPFGKLKEPPIKQSLNTEPPDGWRWLEVGETLRRGDTTNTIDEIPEDWIGIKCAVKHNLLRRNRFEVGEKVVHVNDNPSIVYTVDVIRADGAIIAYNRGVGRAFSPDKLAPYIEETK